jgi:hypothetical protein
MTKPTIEPIVVRTTDEYRKIIAAMRALLEKHDIVTLGELYVVIGRKSRHEDDDDKWGWKNLMPTTLVETPEGYLITFPPLEDLS